MKAWKIILIVVAVILIAVGTASWFLLNNMDRMARESMEEGGMELLGVPVSLDEVNIKLLAGKARFKGLQIANPEGFSSAPALTLGLIEVDIDLATVDEDVLVIESILIRDPVVNYEINAAGVANIDVLQQKINEKVPPSGSDTGLMIIDRLDIKGGTIVATAASRTDERLEFDFPVLFMSNIGEPHGLPPEELGAEISEALMERITKAAREAGVDRLVEEQRDRLIEKASEKLDEKLKNILKKRG